MSTKDYVIIARAVNDGLLSTREGDKARAGIEAVARVLCSRLAAAHPAGYPFSRSKFLIACGVEGSES
jgi:hypothetical protein